MPTEGKVRLEVYDVTGALIKTLLNEEVGPGNKELTWDGTTMRGAKASTGMYICRLQAGGFTAQKKMMLIK